MPKVLIVDAGRGELQGLIPELEGRGGLYLEDCSIGEPDQGQGTGSTGYAAYALDPELADRLWSLSEDLVGQRFAF